MNSRCSPLATAVEMTDCGPDGATGTAGIGSDDIVFAGHYPGFPVLPGVYIVELVERVVRASLGEHSDLELRSIDRCRFMSPVYPGDTITVRTVLTRSGLEVRAAASVSTARGAVAELRVRYQPEADR